MIDLTLPRFTDPDAAREYLESVRWPDGPFCPHCGGLEKIYTIHRKQGDKIRKGLYKCGDCRKQFTVTVGTVMERSHIPIQKWVMAAHLMCSSKKGISAHQLHRMMGITYKSAWFLAHRLREAMRRGSFDVMGGNGVQVEVDETFIGHDKTKKRRSGYGHTHKVLALVDRSTGQARSMVVDDVKLSTIMPILRRNIAWETHVMTDEASQYIAVEMNFAKHDSVNHGVGEYGRGEVHTNTIEGYFSIFKRGMKGVYQHCDKAHLHRYLAEFDHRYSYREKTGYDDEARTRQALRGIEGKRLTYNPISQ